jgi:hypothetical protein
VIRTRRIKQLGFSYFLQHFRGLLIFPYHIRIPKWCVQLIKLIWVIIIFTRSVYLYFICIIFSSININNFSKFNIAIFSFKSNHIIFENDVDISRSHVEIKEISIVTIIKNIYSSSRAPCGLGRSMGLYSRPSLHLQTQSMPWKL